MWRTRITLLICLSALVACGGHRQASQDNATTVPDGLAAVAWPPDDTRAAASLSFTGFNTNGISSGSSKEGQSVFVRASGEDFGWAQFKVGGFSAADAPLSLSISSYALDSECWLAVADYARGAWHWVRCWEYGEEPSFTLPGGADLVSPTGNLHFVFAVESGNTLDLTGGAVATLDASGLPYPRLGMWYGDFEHNTLSEIARYDVLIDNWGGKHVDWDDAKPLLGDALRELNPDATLLTYTAFSEISYGGEEDDESYNPWLRNWPDSWFLTEAGTALAGAISATQTEITVAVWTQSGEAQYEMPTTWDIFHEDGDVLCGGEIMTVTGLDEETLTLTVERNRYGKLSAGAAHSAGARIAPIVRFWPGTFMMNLTSACPTATLDGASAPEQWSDYYFRMSLNGEEWFDDYSYDQDGFLFDRMEDAESWLMWDTANSVDLDQDNTPETFAEFDSAWLTGIEHITGLFHAQFPDTPVLRNLGGGRRFTDYNGNHFESWPMFEGWDEWPGRATGWVWEFFGIGEDYPIDWEDQFGGVNEWAAQSPAPNFTWIETYEDEDGADGDGDGSYENPFDEPGFTPDYQKLRWGLASALLAGAYYSYEINTNGHGSLGLMWFDEYDGAGLGRGWLGWPAGDLVKLKDVPEDEATLPADPVHEDVIEYGVWAREYTNGLVIVNPCAAEQEVELPAGRWQRLNGSQASTVNNGAVEEGTLTMPAYDGLLLRRAL